MGRSDVVVPCYEADSTRDMDESVGSVEDGQSGLVTGHEPVLDAVLGKGEEEAERAVLFEFEDGETVGFGDVPDGLGEDLLRKYFCQAVEEIGNYPVEHFNEKGEFLQDAAMDVVGKAGGVGGIYGQPTASSSFWEFFRGGEVILRVRVVVWVVKK